MNKIYDFDILKDEDIKSSIEREIENLGWENAYITGAIGSAKDLVVTAPEGFSLPPEVVLKELAGPAEVLSFTGEIMLKENMDPDLRSVYKEEGQYFTHIHISVAVAGGQTYGGGLKKGKSFRKIRVFMMKL